MSKKRQSKRVYGKATHRWRIEMKPLLLACLLVEMVIEKSREAYDIFNKLTDAWDRPGCLLLLRDKLAIPKEELIIWEKVATNKSEYISDLDLLADMYEKYSKDEDVRYLFNLISDFIRIGFNRRKDLEANQTKVKASNAIFLCLAVGIVSAGCYFEKHPEWEGETQLKIGDKVLDLSALNGVSENRLHRKYTKVLKRYGYRLSHDYKLNKMARL